MFPAHALPAKKPNGNAIDTAVLAILLAEFAPTVGNDPPTFEPDKFFEEHVAFGPPNQQGIFLTRG